MKYQNLTGKDVQLPVRQPSSLSGVKRPVNHIVVKDGAIVDIEDSKFAISMGLTSVKAVNSQVGETEVETKVVDSVPEKKVQEVPEKPTEKELFDLNKSEQIKILNKLGIKEIPKLEKQRVAKILELQ